MNLNKRPSTAGTATRDVKLFKKSRVGPSTEGPDHCIKYINNFVLKHRQFLFYENKIKIYWLLSTYTYLCEDREHVHYLDSDILMMDRLLLIGIKIVV